MEAKPVIQAQYRASLAMLRDAIGRCTQALWTDSSYKVPFWRVSYHTLFFTHLYLSESFECFLPWDKHIDEYESLGPMPHKGGRQPKDGPPYPKADILEYDHWLAGWLGDAVDALDLDGPSGFPWLPFGKLELQFYNIRHIQHHAAHLIHRIRHDLGQEVPWVGTA